MQEFHEIVDARLTQPILKLCHDFADRGAHEEYTYFAGVLNLLADPNDEEMVLAATIELSRCAFLGFEYTEDARLKIDKILEDAIDLAHTMSASGAN
ncbi:MAG: hypothetical protein JJ934_02550 [Pseudomonadales bacterium]|nr:hypothetical protein [Pseudomonadales bacterium]MBO6566061.1 hypothetical protein [Pseudomonadales bacterium]MBO6595674.1 hypothetical protein [Pseudomonadales bacterium]MBO6655743.1 hypothetical protein [Pseudomonadales bacterium]MBO6702174.1 hypothetical protein [Pseudomonadales bacterium]